MALKENRFTHTQWLNHLVGNVKNSFCSTYLND